MIETHIYSDQKLHCEVYFILMMIKNKKLHVTHALITLRHFSESLTLVVTSDMNALDF